MWYVLIVAVWLAGPAPEYAAGQPHEAPVIRVIGGYYTKDQCDLAASNLAAMAKGYESSAVLAECIQFSNPATEKGA